MASRHSNERLSQLWQVPLMLLAVGLFVCASYLFIDPQPGMTIEQRIEVGRVYMNHDRPEAAIDHLNALLRTERLSQSNEGRIHLMLAEALEQGQRLNRIDLAANHERIIEQTKLALERDVRPTAAIHRRLAESYEALGRPGEALTNYRRAMALDPDFEPRLQRRVIELQLDEGEYGAAEASLEAYLRGEEIRDSEKAWAAGVQARMLIEREQWEGARELLEEALRLDMDRIMQGELHHRLGYIAWRTGDVDEAERFLRVARDQLGVGHDLDAEASYLLGEIHQHQGDPETARSFYHAVLVMYPDSRVAPPARLGRGMSRIKLGEEDAGLTDLHDLVNHINRRESRIKYKAETLAGLRRAVELLSESENYKGALDVLAFEQALEPEPQGEFFARLARVYTERAMQVEAKRAVAAPSEEARLARQVFDLRTQAGDAFIAYSRALTLADDEGYGEAMWKGIDSYDRAGNVQRAISALEVFTSERPDDAMAPEALLRLGRVYQAAGMFEEAIEAYRRNQLRHPQTLAASKSAVPLAQAYVAQGPEAYGKAENVLLGVIEDNPLLTPESETFQEAIFELAQLYYRTGRYEESIARLEEWTQRYPDDQRLGQMLFLMADSYRKSAGLLEARLAASGETEMSAADHDEVEAANRQRLLKAKELFDQVIELYRANPPEREVDKLHQKLAHFYRADCLYDLGEYEEAIRLYDTAAFRYQEDPSALAAYVQIVNAYFALGKLDEARTANERAKWLLRRMPAEAFADGSFAMPKQYWEQWLQWTTEAGMW